MGIKHMNYLSIPAARRRKAAGIQLQRLREELVMNPALTQEQKDAIQARIDHLNNWVNGTVDGISAIDGDIQDALP